MSICTLPAYCVSISQDYKELADALASMTEYCPLCLNDFAPSNHYRRHHWIDLLALPYKVVMMKCPHGNGLDTMFYMEGARPSG